MALTVAGSRQPRDDRPAAPRDSLSRSATDEGDTTTSTTSIQWQLVARPHGEPTPDDVVRARSSLPELADGEVRVAERVPLGRPLHARPHERREVVRAAVRLDETMTGGAVGRVVESRSDDLPVGTVVMPRARLARRRAGPGAAFRARASRRRRLAVGATSACSASPA